MTAELDHGAIAVKIASEDIDAPVAKCAIRQGDVVMRRIADTPDPAGKYGPTPQGGAVIAAGAHGEHRLIGDNVAFLGDGKVSIQGRAVLVHTDVPDARHGSIAPAPGVWSYHRLREMTMDDAMMEVAD